MAIVVVMQGRDETGPAAASASENIRQMGDTAERQGSRLSGFFSGLKTAILGAGAAVAIGIGAVAGSGLQLNNSMEQAGARIQAFTKDAGATADILAMVQERAASTPFAFNEMATAAANLLPSARASGVGLEELIAQAEILAASNPAEGLEGAAFALKEAVSGDFTSVIERFNLPRQRLNELKEQGVPALEAVKIAMGELGLDADLVTGLAGTLEGRWSTFLDTMQNLAATITQPLFDALSSGLGDVQGLLDANMPLLQGMADMFAGALANAIQWLITVGIPQLVAWWAQLQPILQPIVARVLELAGAFSATGDPIANVSSAIQAFLAEAGGALIGQLGAWAQALGAWVLDALPGLGANLATLVQGLYEQIGAAVPGIVEQLATWAAAFIQWVIDAVPLVTAELGAFAASMYAWFVAQLPAIVAQLAEWALAFVAWVLPAGAELILNLGTAFGDLLIWLVGQAPILANTISTEWIPAITAWVAEVWPQVQAQLESWWGEMQAWLSGIASNLAADDSIGTAIINGIKAGISAGVGALRDAVTNAARSALEAAKRALGIASPSQVFAQVIGLPIAQGLALGIQQGAPLVSAAGAGLAMAAVSGAQSISRGGDTYNVDARGATQSAAQIAGAIRRTQNSTAAASAVRARFGV